MQTVNDKVQLFVRELTDGNTVINQVQADLLIKICREEEEIRDYKVKMYEFDGQLGNYVVDKTFQIDHNQFFKAVLKVARTEETRGFYWFAVMDGEKPILNIYTANRNYFTANG